MLFWISLPLWVVLTCGVLFGGVTGTAAATGGFTFVAFLVQFSVAASYNITYAPYVSDYSRYLPRNTKPSAIIASVFLGASASPAWLIPLGAWMATYLGASDALAGINQTGNDTFSYLGSVLAVVSTLVLVATMGLNAYSGMLTVVTGLDSLKSVTPDPQPAGGDHRRAGGGVAGDEPAAVERDHRAQHDAADHAVPAGPVDRGQPDRLLLRPPRPLRDRRSVHPQRNLRRLVVARTGRLPRRRAGRDPVRRPALLRRTRRRSARRGRHRLHRGPAGLRPGLHRGHPVTGRVRRTRVIDAKEHRRDRRRENDEPDRRTTRRQPRPPLHGAVHVRPAAPHRPGLRADVCIVGIPFDSGCPTGPAPASARATSAPRRSCCGRTTPRSTSRPSPASR